MRFKKMMRGIALLLMTVLLSVSVCPLVSHADKISDLKKSIQDKQDAIDKAQNEKKALQSGLTDVKKVISGLQTSKQNLSNYISQLDDSLSQAQARILELNTMITDKEAEITKTAAELEDAIATEETQYQAMKDRIKFIYEKGDSFYLEMVLTAESFGEMLNKAEYVEKLSAYDKRMLEQYQATRQYVAVCKEQLEAEQELLQEAKTDVEKEQKSLETLISQKEQEITAYESDINNQQALVKEYEAEIAAQNAEIKAMEDLVAAQKAELAKENKAARTYDGGRFAWPAPSYTRISDDYGNRMHPTLHVQQFHNGIDLASPGGSPILAAYDGTVVSAAYSSTMGNYVMLDHGDNLYTIYMHASALYVSKGENVVKGQKIAAVGSTGRSTGNHLHFSVRLNGSYVSPWNYLSH